MKKIVLLTLLWSLWAFPMQIKQIDMAKEAVSVGNTYNVEGITDNFSTHQKVIYGIVQYSHASLNDKVVIKWISEDAINVPNYEIAKLVYPLDRTSGVIRATLTLPAKVWPKGHYRVEIYSNGQKIAKKHFSIGMPKGHVTQDAHITNLSIAAYAGHDKDGYIDTKGVSDTFDVTQRKLFAVVEYKDLKVPGKFTFEWYVDKAGDISNQRILSTPLKIIRPSGAAYTQIIMDENWPVGDFRVDVYYNGRKLAVKHFKIRNISPHPEMANTAQPATNTTQRSSIIQDLIGSKWIDRSAAKPLVLSFPSLTQFDYGGNVFTCTIDATVIKVNGNKGLLILPYTIKNDKLYLELNGNTGVFERMPSSTKPAVTPLGKLKGRYCSSKNESNEWISFDGAGHFSFGSLANSIVAAEGSYTLKGEWITIHVKGENLGKIHITKQQGAHIDAFEFDKITYTQARCP